MRLHLPLLLSLLLVAVAVADTNKVAEADADAETNAGTTVAAPVFLPDLGTALETARAEDRPVLVYFTSPGCAYCTQLRDTVFVQREVKAAMSRFVLAEVNLASDRATVMRYNVRGFPSLIVLSPAGQERSRQTGFARGPQLTAFLKKALGGIEAPPEWEKRLETDALTSTDWPEVLLALADQSRRQKIRKGILQLEDPEAGLVEALGHQQLSVRLAAIELLEERTGDSRSFDPFAAPDSPASRAAQRAWLEKTSTSLVGNAALDPERVRAAVSDLDGSDPVAQQRASRLLATGGPVVHAALAEALAGEALSAGARREVESIRLGFLIDKLPNWDGPATAHRLVHANLDIRIDILRRIADSGQAARPILLRFADHPEALLREVALESLAKDRSSHAQLAKALQGEENLDVLIATLRALKKVPGKSAFDILVPRLEHPNEDVVLAALNALGNEEAVQRIKGLLPGLAADPRWRVRARAFELVAERDQPGLLPKELLSKGIRDEDAFVRQQAMNAMVASDPTLAKRELRDQFLESDDAKLATFPMLVEFNAVNKEMVANIKTRPRELQLEILRMMRDDDKTSTTLALAYADHEDEDFAVFGLTELCREIKSSPVEIVPDLVFDTLKGTNKVRVATVLRSVNSLVAKKDSDDPFSSRSSTLRSTIDLDATTVDLGDDALAPVITVEELMSSFVAAVKGTNAAEESTLDFPRLTAAVRPWLEAEGEIGEEAARLLLPLGDEGAFKKISGRLEDWPEEVRSRFYRSAFPGNGSATRWVFETALDDPSEELRREARYALLSHAQIANWIDLYLSHIEETDVDIATFQSNISLLTRNKKAPAALRTWALEKLAGNATERKRALLLLLSTGKAADVETVFEFLDHEDQWTRRLAVQFIAKYDIDAALEKLADILGDPSMEVSAGMVQSVTLQMSSGYAIYKFDEKQQTQSYTSTRGSLPLSDEHLDQFKALLETTTAPELQVELSLLLLGYQIDVDIDRLQSAMAACSDPVKTQQRLLSFISTKARTLPPSATPLVASLLEDPDIQESRKRSLQRYFPELAGPASAPAPAPVRALLSAEELQRGVELATGVVLDDARNNDISQETHDAASAGARLLVFYREGCSDCAEVEKWTTGLKSMFPTLVVERFDVDKPEGESLQRKLIESFKPGFSVGKAPSVFAANGVLADDQLKFEPLISLAVSSVGIPRSEWDPRFANAEEAGPGEETVAMLLGRSSTEATALQVVTGSVSRVASTETTTPATGESRSSARRASAADQSASQSSPSPPPALTLLGLVPLLLLLGKRGNFALLFSLGVYLTALLFGLLLLNPTSMSAYIGDWGRDLIAALGWLLPAFICLHRAIAPARDEDPVRRPAWLIASMLGLFTALLMTGSGLGVTTVPLLLALVLAIILGPLRLPLRARAWPWWAGAGGFVCGYALMLAGA